jgi:glycosyltransferase involved in cell wall biosynthesis
MNVGLYIEHGSGNGVGGAELLMAHVASVWSQTHHVDLIHHRPPLTRERLELFSDDDYSRVRFRFVPREVESEPEANPFRRFRRARSWHAAVSEGYDVFINCTHWLPCFSHAKASTLLVLFPFYVRPPDLPELQGLPAWRRWRHRAYYDTEWTQRLATYQHRLSISQFSAQWTRRRWGLATQVLYPPVDVTFVERPKDDMILSVGRFSTMAHTKKQLEMMTVFAELQHRLPHGWSYASVGGLNTRPENHKFFEHVRTLGAGYETRVEANVPRPALRQLFERARIYWHATGFGEPTDVRPELCEHFGIATVEAMAAGCVPIVINKGGQPEIVEHGRSGFVWNTLAELQHYTLLLANNPARWSQMSSAARTRAQAFRRERFVERLADVSGIRQVPKRDVTTNMRVANTR